MALKLILLTIGLCTLQSCSGYSLAQKGDWTNKKAEIYFLLDTSYSVWIVDYNKLLKFVASLVDDMDIRPEATRVGVGIFSEQHTLYIPIDDHRSKSALQGAIMEAPCIRGNTYISRALQGMMQEGLGPSKTRTGVPKMTVLITDGMSRHKQLTQDNATLAKKEGVYLFTLGIGYGVDSKELLSIASDPKSNFNYHVADYNHLADIKAKLSQQMSEVEFLQGDKSGCGDNTHVDTVFVYDEAAMGLHATAKVNQFIAYMADRISMDSGNMRVGVVSKTCSKGDITLGQFLTRADFKEGLTSRNRGSAIRDLMERARTQAFRFEQGGRPDVERRIVLIMHDHEEDRGLLIQGVRAKHENTELFVICLGDSKNKNFITSLATSAKHALFYNDVDELVTPNGRDFFRHKFCERL